MKKVISLCPHCMDDREASIETLTESLTIRTDVFSIESPILRCLTCNQEFNNSKIPNIALDLAYTQYRKKYNLLQPKDLSKFRHDLRLSILEMAELLNIEPVNWRYYETGALMDHETNEKIKSIMTKKGMRLHLKNNKINIELKWKVEKWL